MPKRRNPNLAILVLSVVVIIAGVFFWVMAYQQRTDRFTKQTSDEVMLPEVPKFQLQDHPIDEQPTLPAEDEEISDVDVNNPEGPSQELINVVRARRTWGVTYYDWLGKTAPDFVLTDIKGKKHKLSDYRGRKVMLIFWATWCGPCKIEIPGLIELRDTISTDELIMLAISNEPYGLLKDFASRGGINYPVLTSSDGKLPSPFNSIPSIPTDFFIDEKGVINLATVGVISLEEVKAIIKAL